MEETFQKALDTNPLDQTMRLVFADWLDEQGDPRAVGYRAIANLDVQYWHVKSWSVDNWVIWNAEAYEREPNYKTTTSLPGNWFWNIVHPLNPDTTYCAWFNSRAEIDDAVALAFSKLSPAEQEQILNEAYSSTS